MKMSPCRSKRNPNEDESLRKRNPGEERNPKEDESL